MCLKMLWRTLLCAALSFICPASFAAPLLNGMSIHQELGNELFIGALYSETLSDNAEALINNPVAKRMELKVVASEGLAVRRFSRMWIEGMAINNSSNLLTSQADNMVKFDGLFKGRLHASDHVVFALTPGQGVSVAVNDILLGTIEDDDFFKLLLSTWIGRVPLSTGYKNELLKLGDVSANLRTRYDSLSPSAARSNEIAAWHAPTPAPEASSSSSQATLTVAARSSAPAPRVELPALSQPVTAPSSAAVSSAATPAPEPEPEVVAHSSVTPITPIEEEDEEEAEPALTAQSLLARQFYVSDILKKVRENVRYPRRSQERNQEGSVRIAVTIDRQGNIINMVRIEESRFELLNNEAWEAVKRASPFPPIPDSLNMQTFEFSAPITFEMQR